MAVLAASAWLIFNAAQATATDIPVRVDPQEATAEVPPHFLGLSFETSSLLPQPDGHYAFFTGQNADLAKLMTGLGVTSLRIGGNTADTPTVPVPSHQDIDNLFAFAGRDGMRVIYTVRMRGADAKLAADTAKYVWSRYGAQLDCIAIGNEPNIFEAHDFDKYAADMNAFLPAVLQDAPDMRICGPGSTSGDPDWAVKYTQTFSGRVNLAYVTEHTYPGGNGKTITSAAAARAFLLNPDIDAKYSAYAQNFLPELKAKGLKFRLEETNSYHHAGAPDVSNTFAATLWGLGYLNWWLNAGADGVNFHTGLTTAAGDVQSTCWYAIFWQTGGKTTVLPLAYALKAFSLTAQGRILPVHVPGAPPSLQAFGTLAGDGTIMLTLINRSLDAKDGSLSVAVETPAGYRKTAFMRLRSERDGIETTSAITLGGAGIAGDGAWRGGWTALPPSTTGVTIPAASAVIIKMTK